MAAVTVPVGASGSRSQSWGQKYPPLLAIGVALAIALIVLPSSLNLPQTNPTTTLEYAPVPPEDDDPPPPNDSNLDSLSVAGSSTIDEGSIEGAGGDLPEPDDLLPNQKTPSTKRCVGNPPRQTEDPLSPPCVASFTGDNFGATYQGVTKDEIVVLFYFDNGGTLVTSRSAQESPPDAGTYVDLDAPDEEDDDYIDIRNLRIWMKYFNERFQTYGRHVHGYAYFTAADTAEGRRADASEVTSGRVIPKPFAYIDQATFNGHNAAFLDAMAKRGVMNFGSLQGLANAFYRKYEPLVWGYWPDIERTADMYVSYVCARVAPYNVTHAGDQFNGQKRKFGLIYTSDPGYPGLQLLANYVKQGVEACGAKIEDTATFPVAGYSVSVGQDTSYATTQMARFSANGITTILWAGGQEVYFSKAATSIQYFPEFIVSGDRIMESYFNASQQDPAVWDHAWVVTNVVREGRFDDSVEVQAFREASGPDYPRRDIQYAIDAYKDIFQMFRAIQVAGPRLGPTSIDKGFHAIPKFRSEDPRRPAGYYEPKDYSYVKDAAVMWWDSGTQNPYSNQSTGCYRMIEGGKRYLAGTWTQGDEFQGRAGPNDECNAYDTGINIRTGAA